MLQDDARDANGARGTVGNASLAGFIAKCFARIPSVDAAERVFAREPPLGKFLADPASYVILHLVDPHVLRYIASRDVASIV
jgi:hypothetical protein